MLKEAILRIGAAALLCVAGCQDAAPLPKAQVQGGNKVDNLHEERIAALSVVGLPKARKTREEIRALFPAFQWLETKHGKNSFMFCVADAGQLWGVQRIVIQGWMSSGDSKVWTHVLTVRLNNVSDVKLSVDPKTGVLSAKDIGRHYFDKDKPICTFDLSAGAGW